MTAVASAGHTPGPRARALTRLLTAPADGPALPAGAGTALARRLTAGLRRATGEPGEGPLHLATPLRITGYWLRAGDPGPTGQSPFRWSPRTTRRIIGLAALRRCVAGAADSPLSAVGQVLDDARSGRIASASWGPWLAALPPGALGLVAAEAVGWATEAYDALDWARLDHPLVGAPDRFWDVPGLSGLALRGRAEVRALVPGDDGPRPVLLCVMTGWPGADDGAEGVARTRAEILLAALVDVVRRPAAVAPARVVGWWPASGRTLALAVDEPGLAAAAARVEEVAGSALRRPGSGHVPGRAPSPLVAPVGGPPPGR